MDGHERRKERVRQSILSAATELFNAHGFKKVSIKEIASKAGVSPVSIYNHFVNKDGLIEHVFNRIIDEMKQVQLDIFDKNIGFPEKIERFMTEKDKWGKQYKGELIQLAVSSNPGLQQSMKEATDYIFARTVQFFEDGKKQGYVNPELSAEAILTFTQIFTKGIIAHYRDRPRAAQDPELIRQIRSIYLYGLMGKANDGPNFCAKGKET